MSQTTQFYDWQAHPVLIPELLDEVCGGPEFFLMYDANRKGAAVLERARLWIRTIYRIEPRLHRWRNQMRDLWHWIAGRIRSMQ